MSAVSPVVVMAASIMQARYRGNAAIAPLSRLAESQIDALAAEQRVLAIGERRHTMEEQPRRAAPDHDIAVLQPVANGLVRSLQATEHEDRRQAQRHRDDRRGEILLIAVLMQRHARTGLVAVDQA